ncbi:ABC transporter ATP-binding protein [Candidatus Protochlamydia sp. W-9]|uniref:ABC transporter ATP-binding protein n=1 Tax=Candidatus Protochlamydia sp. W-9 TaxID=1785087 RepID=UPI00096A7B56|nr:ATP-binding cassette domain-containing protein [Candidatus Protochlamydia sp. W-9]
MCLIIKNISFSYPNHSLLKNVTLTLKQGEIGTLIGASGSGKSTLFKLLVGLLPLQEGAFYAMDHSQAYEYFAYMTQQDLLLPWRTVLENVILISELGPKSTNLQEVKEDALKLLTEMGLKKFIHYYPEQLSGGMRQRASLARALLLKKPILLLDEPFGALDTGLREHLYSLLHEIRDKYGTTILLVTHDFRDAISLSDRLFLLAHQHIQKDWILSTDIKSDFTKMNYLQSELRQHLNYCLSTNFNS